MDEQKTEESSVFLFIYIGRKIFTIINIDILYSNSRERESFIYKREGGK